MRQGNKNAWIMRALIAAELEARFSGPPQTGGLSEEDWKPTEEDSKRAAERATAPIPKILLLSKRWNDD